MGAGLAHEGGRRAPGGGGVVKRLVVMAALDRLQQVTRLYFAYEVGFETAVIADGSTPSQKSLHGLVLHFRTEDEGVSWCNGWDIDVVEALRVAAAL